MKIKTCPFCGSTNLKASSRGTRSCHRLAQVFCLNCGARGPMVRSDFMDRRDSPSESIREELDQKAFDAFTTVAEKNAASPQQEFKLEP